MTLNMPDSIYPGNLPGGYPAYLGYPDGRWRTAPALRSRFIGAHVVALTVTGETLEADGIDIEPGNPNAASGADWVRRKLAADPGFRPIAYADLESPGYSMGEVLTGLAAFGIARQRVRLLTAHYDGQHLCSPSRGCRDRSGNVITFTADGTQWTSAYPGAGGAVIDMSLLADDFFGTPVSDPVQNWTEKLMQALPTVRQGSTGGIVRTIQGLCVARGHPVAVDGSFGNLTQQAVIASQKAAGATADGIVGPVTWSVLITGSAS